MANSTVKHLTGYYREKIDKEIQKIASQLKTDKKFIIRTKHEFPKIAQQIKHSEQTLKHCIEHEQ